MKEKNFEKINVKIGNKHTAMYPCTKCQSIRKTSDFATKFAQKNMNDKNFEKINVKIIISI